MSLPRYESYKDSGVKWLGEVPEHWDNKRLKHIGDSFIGLIYDPNDVVDDNSGGGILVLRSSNVQDGLIVFDDNVFVNKVIPDRLKTRIGDILICSRNGSRALIGKNAIIDENSQNQTFGAFMTVFRCYMNDYVFWIFNSQLFKAQSGSFLTSTINQLTVGNLMNFEILIPPLYERQLIISFLQQETAKIDNLIAEQQQLIKLLKEKRQAVISHAVTKGLNPDVPMKDSGVEWLGEVPEHWVRTKAKFVSDIFVPQRNKPELNENFGVAWATMEDMKGNYIETVNNFVDSPSAKIAGSKVLKAGAVIASCVGSFDVVSINKINVIINQQLQAFIPHSIKAEYLRELIRISKSYFELVGTATTLVYVNQKGFAELPILLPTTEEQDAIILFLDQETTTIDTLIAESTNLISLSKERRSALISSAVTGKIDVRNYVSTQPQVEAMA